jgi:hypothetical protein
MRSVHIKNGLFTTMWSARRQRNVNKCNSVKPLCSDPVRYAVPADELCDLDARAHQGEASALDQDLRDERPRIIGSGLHRSVGARRHHGEKIAGRGGNHVAVERKEIAGFADRPDHVGDDA